MLDRTRRAVHLLSCIPVVALHTWLIRLFFSVVFWKSIEVFALFFMVGSSGHKVAGAGFVENINLTVRLVS